ncbi:phosphonoacetate hydrolase [Aestuariispira ectoiniformans]|uniref:phosphonoacetate hydrolase n=1 Tax=Aestuariispira ectoiniformans TaxID=2775080 RepID=UPI00223B1597|nr:phosphonoacetate hydrolase [Aestuariispira ectoiniformans]
MMIEVNGRQYAKPENPVVVVCVDGSEPGYIEEAVKTGDAPFFAKVIEGGTNRLAKCVVPSFTNPNNLSIVTGRPPEVHGICGNFFYDTESDSEIMMNDPSLLRVPTIFKAFQDAGAKVAVITAKDKLRRLLGNGLTMKKAEACSFSSEKSDQCTLDEHGIEGVNALVGMDVPSVYSAELSEFVFAAGVKIMERDRPDLMYLSTTDYIQHKHAPGTPVANAFYIMMDKYLGQLDAMGCTIIITADHGMNAKHKADGQPDVIFLQDVLDEWYGKNRTRVICPITDPYVVHHGALGSYVTAYLPEDLSRDEVLDRIRAMDGIEVALTREDACSRFQLPQDRVGDIVVVSNQNKVLGTSADRHDLSQLKEPLRSHGGISEQNVPLMSNKVTDLPDDAALRNFDAFFVGLNHTKI